MAKRASRRSARPSSPAKKPRAPPKTPQTPTAEPHPPGSGFPIVGIGASAGGLEALELFLKHVPKHSGMAFVVVQHLDPTHEGAIVELLQRATEMPVFQVKDRQPVKPDTVFVIPPNKDMSILHGVLHLMPQTSPRGLNLPIDFFLRSLAEDQQDRSVGVILSGMGSDGTLGMRAIKEKAGAAFVQSLSSAKFDSMPRSVIDAGLADLVAAAEELPPKILSYLKHPAAELSAAETPLEDQQQSALEKVLILLRTRTGSDFSLYKKSTTYRRIERRMSLHQIDKVGNYVRYLRENPHEADLLFKELLIGVTSFFRDPPAWEYLRTHALRELLDERGSGVPLRCWVPGCSTGEEAYSLAIVLREAIERFKPDSNVAFQIFATDLDRDAIEKARQGLYPANIAADVSTERLRRFFVQEERGYRVRKDIRELVVFAPQNIIMDPPFTKLDILSCRNLLIYLSADLQKKLIPLFHYSLSTGGILFLGNSETIGPHSEQFLALDGKIRIYRRLDAPVGAPAVEFPSSFVRRTHATREEAPGEVFRHPLGLQALVDRVTVQRFSPTVLLTSDKGDLLYTSGRTGQYLEPPVGKANLNVFSMAREGLRFELSTAFGAAVRGEKPITVRSVKVGNDGGTQTVDLTVQRLAEPRELSGMVIIVISEIPKVPGAVLSGRAQRLPTNVRMAELQKELQQSREEVQTIREEMQTSQEELKSTNEELQSTNEELQSTNEELTTSKEEMQSMNEELQTVNHELQAKVDELSRANNDMKNLLNSTDIATLFLDGELLVRRFTTQTAKLIKLIPADAGRPITDIASSLDYPALADDAREVLRTLVFKEKQVANRDGNWFAVRIMPYRTLENVIDGVVITFTDATRRKVAESALLEQASQLRQMTESLPTLVWGCRPDGSCDYVSKQWVAYTGVSESEQLGFGWLAQVHPDDREAVRAQWRASVQAEAPLNVEFRIRAKDGVYRWFKTRSVPIRDEGNAVVKWYGTSMDVDDLKRALDGKASPADGRTAELSRGSVREP